MHELLTLTITRTKAPAPSGWLHPQVVMSYLSFLCSRLLDLRNETRAARLIQGAWRRFRLRKGLQLQEVSVATSDPIQPL